jgi:hypothetical protein
MSVYGLLLDAINLLTTDKVRLRTYNPVSELLSHCTVIGEALNMNVRFIMTSLNPGHERSVSLSADRGAWERICTIIDRFLAHAEDEAGDISLSPTKNITASVSLIRDRLKSVCDEDTVEIEFPRNVYVAMVNGTLAAESLKFDVVPGTDLPLDPDEFEQIKSSLERVSEQELAAVLSFAI